MSSPGLPTLTIDVAARRGEHRVVYASLALVSFAFWQWDLPLLILAGVAASGLIVMVAGYRALGWLNGGARLARIVCQADGGWVLYEATGRAMPARLSPQCRISPHALWLRWDARGRRPLLLLPGDVPDDDFRRLLVRLRMASLQPRDEHETVL
jgi:hypothetical protein